MVGEGSGEVAIGFPSTDAASSEVVAEAIVALVSLELLFELLFSLDGLLFLFIFSLKLLPLPFS